MNNKLAQKIGAIAIVMSSMLFTASPTLAATGYIAYADSSCDYFIVETNRGFALLEWYGGYSPSESDIGDVLVGNYERYGFKNIYDATAKRKMRVWVEDYWLSQDSVIEKYWEK